MPCIWFEYQTKWWLHHISIVNTRKMIPNIWKISYIWPIWKLLVSKKSPDSFNPLRMHWNCFHRCLYMNTYQHKRCTEEKRFRSQAKLGFLWEKFAPELVKLRKSHCGDHFLTVWFSQFCVRFHYFSNRSYVNRNDFFPLCASMLTLSRSITALLIVALRVKFSLNQ